MRFGRLRSIPFSAQHCSALVERASWENYICIRSISDLDQRRHLFALNAFNVAILTSIQKVSQPVFAQARIQFLKDGINAIYKNDTVPEHPVLDEIKLVIEQNDLPKSWFTRLINERLKEDRLQRKSFNTVEELEKYSELTTGTLWLLSLATLGIKDVNSDTAAKHAARCIGLTNSIRAQQVVQSREILIPLDFCSKHKIELRNLVEKKNSTEMEEMVFDAASRAHANLTKVKSMRSKIPSTAHPIFRQLTPTEHFLDELGAVNFNLFDKRLNGRYDGLAWALQKKKWKKQF